MRKILIFISLLLIFIYFGLSYRAWFKSDFFKIIFFDVGQGDSTLIITPNGQTILIDGGPDKKILRGLGEVLPFWRRQIDLLIITHAHDDHISGLVEVCRRYQIKNVLYNNLNFKTPALETLNKIFTENNLKLINAKSGSIFKFDNDCSLSVLAATKDIQKNDNDYSVVVMFDCLNRKILLGGDAGIKIEKELLASGINLKADIFKISHHGSFSANSQEFLTTIKPKIGIISVGIDNKFGHPTTLILDRLKELSVKTYLTSQQGTLEFLANYKSISLNN